MTERIMVIGNWELCLSIVSALVPSTFRRDSLQSKVSVLTYPSQNLGLPPHVSRYAIEHKKSDFTAKSLQDAFTGQDIVISTIGGGDSELQIRFIDALVAAGVKKFIPHEFCHDTLNPGIQARIPKYAGRAKVLSHLQNMVTKFTPGFDWIGIATGYPLDTNIINGDMGFDMKQHSATIYGTGAEPFAASSIERVGKVVVAVIQNWAKIDSHYIYAAGVVTSANEVLRATERATHCEWTVGYHDVGDSVREGEKRIERGFPDAGMALLESSVLYDEQLNAHAPFESYSSNSLLQLAPETVAEIVIRLHHDLQEHGK